MRQLTIACSRDLRDRVLSALDRSGMEGFVEMPGAAGSRFQEPGRVPRTLTWEAVVFVVPAADEDSIQAVVQELKDHAGECDIRPCLRMIVSPVDQVY